MEVVTLFVEAGDEIAFSLTFAHAITVERGTKNILEVALFITLGLIKRTTTIYLSEIPVSCRREIEARHEGSIGTKNMPPEKPKKNSKLTYINKDISISMKIFQRYFLNTNNFS